MRYNMKSFNSPYEEYSPYVKKDTYGNKHNKFRNNEDINIDPIEELLNSYKERVSSILKEFELQAHDHNNLRLSRSLNGDIKASMEVSVAISEVVTVGKIFKRNKTISQYVHVGKVELDLFQNYQLKYVNMILTDAGLKTLRNKENYNISDIVVKLQELTQDNKKKSRHKI